jgi:cytidine deaminase
MEFVYEGNNGYYDYAYVYTPTQEELEYALARCILDEKGEAYTTSNIERQLGIIKSKSMAENYSIINYYKEEIKKYLKKFVNADF